MKLMLLACCTLTLLRAMGQDEYSTRDLKNGKFKEDSSYIYALPFENKKKDFF